jgi:uncharacterized protein (DUF885 family)
MIEKHIDSLALDGRSRVRGRAMRRRELLAVTAACAVPGVARAGDRDADAELHALLDQLEPGAKAAASLARLRAFDPTGLSPAARLDRDAVTWGLAIDSRLASGEGSFMLQFERQFGARMGAASLQQKLKAKAAELTARADRLLRIQGLEIGSVGERLRAFARDPRWLYPDSDAGRARAVVDMERWLDAARARLPLLVSGLPASASRVTIRSLSAADIAAGRGGYRDPPRDGRPGAYVVDLREIRRRPMWSLASVVHHETLPGHFVQQTLQEAAAPHRLRLTYAPSFSEGWAIYAEQLADEAGLFAASPAAELGYVQWLLFRIGRALADTGIHLHGWDAARTKAFLAEIQGDPVIFAPFDQEVDRITRAPGARAAEAMTWLAIADLRQGHGPRAAFHHALLRDGAMPFGLLARRFR